MGVNEPDFEKSKTREVTSNLWLPIRFSWAALWEAGLINCIIMEKAN